MQLIEAKDWIALAVWLIGLATAWLSRQTQLPKWARGWLKKIGQDRIIAAIEQVERLADLTPEQRRAEVVWAMQRVAQEEIGLTLPTSIANLLVEFVYQAWKRARR